MTIPVGQRIVKASRDNLLSAADDFFNRVTNAAYSKITYTNTKYPYFTGQASYGKTGNSGSWSTLGWTNPIALPPEQLAAPDTPRKFTITDTKITASTVWTNMLNITRTLIKIRGFTSNWYHKTNGSRNLVNSVQSCGFFNLAWPAVPTGTDGNQSKTEFWERTGNLNPSLNPATEIVKGGKATAASVNNTIQNCYNAWANECFNVANLTYNFYTCHSNCHGSCYSNRGRR